MKLHNTKTKLKSSYLRRRHAYILRERFFYFLKRQYFQSTISFFIIYQKYWAPLLNRISYRLFNKPSALFLATKFFSFTPFFQEKKSPFLLHYKISYLFRSIFRFYPFKKALVARRFFTNNIPSIEKASLLLASSFANTKKIIAASKTFSYSENLNTFSFLNSIKKKVFLSLGGVVLGLRLKKLFNIFSFKGNRNTLFNSFSLILYMRRFLFFKLCYLQFFLFLKKSILGIFKKCDSSAANAETIFFEFQPSFTNNLVLSYFVKRLLGFNFYNINYEKFKLHFGSLLKRVKIHSSFFHLFNSLKSFYLFTELKSLKKSGRSFVVPVPVKSQNRRKFLFYHWLKASVLARSEFSFSNRLFGELVDINLRKGSTVNKLRSLSKLIKNNRVLIRKSRLSLI